MFRLKVYDWFEKVRFFKMGPWQREQGKKLALAGLRLQAPLGSDDRLVPSLRRRSFQNTTPDTDSAQFVAPNACVVGNVTMGEFSAVWYGAVIRGDRSGISLGKNAVVQDLVTMHA